MICSRYFTARGQGINWTSPASYEANITNTGPLASDFVLLGFVSAAQDSPHSRDPQEPIRELFDFARVSLQPGASTVVQLNVRGCLLGTALDLLLN